MPKIDEIERLAAERGLSPAGFKTPADNEPYADWGGEHLMQIGLAQHFFRTNLSDDIVPNKWSARDSAQLTKAAEALHGLRMAPGSLIIGAMLEGFAIQPDGRHCRFKRPASTRR